MDSIETLTAFVGWCSVINIGVIILIFVVLSGFTEGIARLTAAMFGISEAEGKVSMFRFFMQYRLFFAVFNLVPYIALKIMA